MNEASPEELWVDACGVRLVFTGLWTTISVGVQRRIQLQGQRRSDAKKDIGYGGAFIAVHIRSGGIAQDADRCCLFLIGERPEGHDDPTLNVDHIRAAVTSGISEGIKA